MIRVILAERDGTEKFKIQRLLQSDPELQVVADCCDGAEAREKVNVLEPDILVSAIDLPTMSGFEILESVTTVRMPYVIVIAGGAKYATRAFESGVTDYIVKPITKHRFQDSLVKVKRQIERDRRAEGAAIVNMKISDQSGTVDRPSVDRIPIRCGRRVRFLSLSAVRYITRNRNFANLYMVTGEVIHTSESISQLETKLPSERFQRIQRSAIINMGDLREIRTKQGKYEFVMSRGECLLSDIVSSENITL